MNRKFTKKQISINWNAPVGITTVDIARILGIKHAYLMYKLEGRHDFTGIIPTLVRNKDICLNDYFIKTDYVTCQDKTMPCYIVTEKGYSYLLTSFTGEKGKLLRAKYFETFNAANSNNKEKIYMKHDLTLVENDLVPVYTTDKGEKVVYGRELYAVLQSRQDFSTWAKNRFYECDAVENEDYEVYHKKMVNFNGGRPRIDYIIKLDIAKEMAMLERNYKGKRVRRYFIEVERKYKNNMSLQTDPELALLNHALQTVDEIISIINKKLV